MVALVKPCTLVGIDAAIPWRRLSLSPAPPPGWRLPLPPPRPSARDTSSVADAEVIALSPARHRTTVR